MKHDQNIWQNSFLCGPGGHRPGASGIGKVKLAPIEDSVVRNGVTYRRMRSYRARRRKNPFRGICGFNPKMARLRGLPMTYTHLS